MYSFFLIFVRKHRYFALQWYISSHSNYLWKDLAMPRIFHAILPQMHT